MSVSSGLDDPPRWDQVEASRLGYDGDTAAYFDSDGRLTAGGATPTGTSYTLWDRWGGSWCDAEKVPPDSSSAPGTGDDFMCWAAAASNVLQWTGWGLVGGIADTDQVFQYFQDHWSDQGGLMQFGWDWWFEGTNDSEGWPEWSQVDVPGGGFHPGESFHDHFHSQSGSSTALAAIAQYLQAGYGVTLGIYGPGGHAVTCWGYNHNPADPSDYYGIWVTDSDDSKYMADAPDRLHYYEVECVSGSWYLQDYYGSDAWYIDLVQALAPRAPTPSPPPEAPAEIHGSVWQDSNENGVKDAEEPGVPDQLVYLDLNGNGLYDVGTCNAASADVPRTIYDEGTITSTLPVSGVGGPISDVNLTLDITHSWNWDLEAYLISPSGTRVELFTNLGAWYDSANCNFTDTVLDDEAPTSISQASAPFTGCFRPEGLLSTLDGEDPNGTWTLEVTDVWAGDQGTLNAWALEITADEPAATTDAQGSYALTDLAPGAYDVRHSLPSGWTQTLPDEGCHRVTLEQGAVVESIDFGVKEYPPATDLGAVELLEIDGLDLAGEEQWYCCTTSRPGYLSVQAICEESDQGVSVTLYDEDYNQLAASSGSGTEERVDWDSEEGRLYYLRLSGDAAHARLRLINLVHEHDGTVTIHGTAGDDVFEFAAAESHHVAIDELGYLFQSSAVTDFLFDGGGGNDVATLYGSAADDVLVMHPSSASLRGPDYCVEVSNARDIVAHGEGGTDRAYFYDSAGDDRFAADPTFAKLYGDGFCNVAKCFPCTFAYSTEGGDDRAYFYDSAGDDRFAADPIFAKLYGDGFCNVAKYFPYTFAYSTEGGDDKAYFYDSTGDDKFVGAPTYAKLYGDGFYNVAKSFHKVYGYSTAGGTDKAYLYDSTGDDKFVGAPAYAKLYGDGFCNVARSFHKTYGYSREGGTDKAYFYDSAGDDHFIGRPTTAKLYGDGFYHVADSFRKAYAYSTSGGNDEACLFDSAGDDHFVARPATDRLYGDGFCNEASSFRHTYVYSTSGGNDEACLFDSAGDDLLAAAVDWARITYPDRSAWLQGFSLVKAVSSAGGTDAKQLDAVDYVLQLEGPWMDL